MQDLGYDLLRTPVPLTWMNKGEKKSNSEALSLSHLSSPAFSKNLLAARANLTRGLI
jgi:hypothetical protein